MGSFSSAPPVIPPLNPALLAEGQAQTQKMYQVQG